MTTCHHTTNHTDPVCNMKVNTDRWRATFEDRSYYFCSRGCLQKFNNTPRDFLDRRSREHTSTTSARGSCSPPWGVAMPLGRGTILPSRHIQPRCLHRP
ncbi:MAG: YHS domain-containing protein [Nannocystaceae bacterium]